MFKKSCPISKVRRHIELDKTSCTKVIEISYFLVINLREFAGGAFCSLHCPSHLRTLGKNGPKGGWGNDRNAQYNIYPCNM